MRGVRLLRFWIRKLPESDNQWARVQLLLVPFLFCGVSPAQRSNLFSSTEFLTATAQAVHYNLEDRTYLSIKVYSSLLKQCDRYKQPLWRQLLFYMKHTSSPCAKDSHNFATEFVRPGL